MSPEAMPGGSGQDIGSAVQWIQAGGLALFAASIWIEVRALRSFMQKLSESMAAVLEHVRKD